MGPASGRTAGTAAALTDGVVVTPDADLVAATAAVEALTADGTSLGRTPLLRGA